ncbi:MAG TPA: hypothetical protein VHA37_04535 [Candidatus Saccharimonadales bacterium]|nr:hypothetical protein [Candidatus Saccharimonadales bacterium]
MISRLQHMCDWETGGVWLAAAGSVTVRLSALNTALTTLVLLGTVIYTWRRALRKGPPPDQD